MLVCQTFARKVLGAAVVGLGRVGRAGGGAAGFWLQPRSRFVFVEGRGRGALNANAFVRPEGRAEFRRGVACSRWTR